MQGRKFELDSYNGRFEIRSEEVQEILSLIPHWIIRWGMTIIFLTMLILLLVTWIIKYPDIITSRITITAQHPPASIVARSSGKLVLFVKENEYVKRNTYLAAIENPAHIQHVLELKKQLEVVSAFLANPDDLVVFGFNKHAMLGELQVDYSSFLQYYSEYKFFTQANYHSNKIKSIKDQLKLSKDLNRKLIRQEEILSIGLESAQKRYDNAKSLFEEGLISKDDLTDTESFYLEKKYALKSAENNTINNNIQIAEYEKLIMDLNQQFHERRRELALSLKESYKKLQSQFAIWEQKYILKAPTEGCVSFFKFWSDNQVVKTSEEVMTVVPKRSEIVGKVYLSAIGSGKVNSGQKVRVKFDSYAFNEFGVVEGEITSVSQIPRDNRYLINVSLPNGLKTSYHKMLEFNQEMQGDADIITEELRLIERIFRWNEIIRDRFLR